MCTKVRQDLVLKRIATKIGLDPDKFLQIMARNRDFPDHCLIWAGAHTQQGIVRRRYTCIVVKPYPVVVKQYVHRYLLEILHDKPGPAKSICKNTMCVNPEHWFVALPPTIEELEVLYDFEAMASSEWLYEEAEELADRYLIRHGWPLDPTHDLLVDIPPALLAQFQPLAR